MTHDVQRANIRLAAQALAPIARQHQLVLAHGNGPQVGLLALQASAYKEVEAYPLDVLGAQTEGMIGDNARILDHSRGLQKEIRDTLLNHRKA